MEITTARQSLGPVGAMLPVSFTTRPPVAAQRAAAARLERAGYHAAWTNEVLGKDAFTQLGVLLAGTERLTFGTCVANIWVREPRTAGAAAAQLAEAYPGRFVLGLGVGYPEQAAEARREFGSPLATLRDYVTRMPPPDGFPRLLAANGPKMTALAGEIADGALPAFLPPEFTAAARQVLGPDKLLVVGLSTAENRDQARESLGFYLARPAYRARLRDCGYPEELSDRLVDAVVAHGDRVTEKVDEHLAAGADHVILMVPLNGDFAEGIARLARIAPG